MSLYGNNIQISGVTCGMVMRGISNGKYLAVFEREFASLEDIETIPWDKPDIQGACILPAGYGLTVADIRYSAATRSYTVELQVAQQYLGDVAGYHFVGLPTEEQLSKVREWLLWAVTEAEKELGGGTGALKLRQVYDLFVTRFPWLAKVISFELFSTMVDEALEEMRELLDTNLAVSAFVNGVEAQ